MFHLNFQKNKHRGLGFVQGAFQCRNFAVSFSFYYNGFHCAFKTFNCNKWRHKKSVFDGFIFLFVCFYGFNLSGGGGMMVGSWDPGHSSPPRHSSLDSNHRSPAQAVDKGFPRAASASLASGTGIGLASGFVTWEKG